MLNEMMFGFVGQLEKDGYTLPERLVPDISMGLIFCSWLRTEKGIDKKNFRPTSTDTKTGGWWTQNFIPIPFWLIFGGIFTKTGCRKMRLSILKRKTQKHCHIFRNYCLRSNSSN